MVNTSYRQFLSQGTSNSQMEEVFNNIAITEKNLLTDNSTSERVSQAIDRVKKQGQALGIRSDIVNKQLSSFVPNYESAVKQESTYKDFQTLKDVVDNQVNAPELFNNPLSYLTLKTTYWSLVLQRINAQLDNAQMRGDNADIANLTQVRNGAVQYLSNTQLALANYKTAPDNVILVGDISPLNGKIMPDSWRYISNAEFSDKYKGKYYLLDGVKTAGVQSAGGTTIPGVPIAINATDIPISANGVQQISLGGNTWVLQSTNNLGNIGTPLTTGTAEEQSANIVSSLLQQGSSPKRLQRTVKGSAELSLSLYDNLDAGTYAISNDNHYIYYRKTSDGPITKVRTDNAEKVLSDNQIPYIYAPKSSQALWDMQAQTPNTAELSTPSVGSLLNIVPVNQNPQTNVQPNVQQNSARNYKGPSGTPATSTPSIWKTAGQIFGGFWKPLGITGM